MSFSIENHADLVKDMLRKEYSIALKNIAKATNQEELNNANGLADCLEYEIKIQG